MEAKSLGVQHGHLVESALIPEDSACCCRVLLELLGCSFPLVVVRLALTALLQRLQDEIKVLRQLGVADIGHSADGLLQSLELQLGIISFL